VHAKRVYSLANATLGVMTAASLAVAAIGHGLALARGCLTKHAIKQVDRLLSNPGIEVDTLLARWVPYVVGSRTSIAVAMDWTDFDADGQATIMLSLLTGHGRATPLLWLTVDKATLKDRRNEYEYRVLVRLAEILPAAVTVLIVADRGFGDKKLYRVLTDELHFDYVIRFRGNIQVTAVDGEARPAADWLGPAGRARTLRGAAVTAERYAVGTVVCVQSKGMKEPWCLAASMSDADAKSLIALYAKRWSIECGFRDTKDLRFGMGMGSVHVSTPQRRDRLWLLNAFAVALLTLLGAAGEALGYDRHLKSNTAKRRTHSLFRQGCMLYELIPNMPDIRLRPLMERYATLLRGHPVFAESLRFNLKMRGFLRWRTAFFEQTERTVNGQACRMTGGSAWLTDYPKPTLSVRDIVRCYAVLVARTEQSETEFLNLGNTQRWTAIGSMSSRAIA
jgi:Transposase DDE domain